MSGEEIDSKPAIYPWGPPMEEESVKVDFFSSIPAGQSSKKGDTTFIHFGSLFVGEEYLDTYDLCISNIFISLIPSCDEER